MANLNHHQTATSTTIGKPTYRRTIATCSCCGKTFYEVPLGAKSERCGDLIIYDFDCDCRPGLANGVEVVTRNGRALTQVELAFELAKQGVSA